MTNNPYLEIYETVQEKIQALGFDVYEQLPPHNTSYPFVYLGEQFTKDEPTKLRTVGETNLVLHVYGYWTRRKEVHEMMHTLNLALRALEKSENFYWSVLKNDMQILWDGTDDTPLAHGILDVYFKFY